MITKNEEDNLDACLNSVADLVDEIVVADTGSTDRTKEIAQRFRARVIDFEWVDSFAAARNETLRHATGDWIFWMDADDRLDRDNRDKLRALFPRLRDDNIAYEMKCHCFPDPESSTATVVNHVRLFRNHPQIRWEYRIHEQILGAVRRSGGQVLPTDIVIHHVGYEDADLRKAKEQRNLRLLQLDYAEHPHDPFVLFNLGWTYGEMGEPAKALPYLQESLTRSHPTDSIVRKLYTLLMVCHSRLGQRAEALAVCRTGQRYYPADAQLLFQESSLREEEQDIDGAIACLERLLTTREGPHFASVPDGLHGHLTRHHLGQLYCKQGRLAEAEAQWQAALQDQPGFLPTQLELADLYLAQERHTELDAQINEVEARGNNDQVSIAVAALRARCLMAQKEFAAARQRVEAGLQEHPESVYLWEVLSHVLLQEGKNWQAAEEALRTVLRLQPGNAQAQRNLDILLCQLGNSRQGDKETGRQRDC